MKTYNDELHENQLLQTIRIPKNLLFLTDKLPQATYEKNNKRSLKNQNLPDINNKLKKKTKEAILNKGDKIKEEIKIEPKSSIHDILKSNISERERNLKIKEEKDISEEKIIINLNHNVNNNINHNQPVINSNNNLNINNINIIKASSNRNNINNVKIIKHDSNKYDYSPNKNYHQNEIVLPNLKNRGSIPYEIKYDKKYNIDKYISN